MSREKQYTTAKPYVTQFNWDNFTPQNPHEIMLKTTPYISTYKILMECKAKPKEEKKVSLNIVEAVWLGMRWRRWRATKTWRWNRIPKYLRICADILSSLVSPQVVTSKTKKKTEDYQRQRDHHDHTHLSLLNYLSGLLAQAVFRWQRHGVLQWRKGNGNLGLYIAAGFPFSSLMVMNELEESDAFCGEEVDGF